MSRIKTLQATISQLTQGDSGILAADESHPTLEKRFTDFNIEYTPQARRDYRELLLTTPQLEKYINGVILFEETLQQTDQNNIPFPEILKAKGIVPGIKVDKGLANLSFSTQEKITEGFDGLSKRLKNYANMGMQFAKWRATFTIQEDNLPSFKAIEANAQSLALYAASCQEQAIVPIVEPEVLLEGSHSLEKCKAVTELVLHQVFSALYKYGVLLEYILLKPNMVTSGSHYQDTSFNPEKIAHATLQVLRHTVPPTVPSINFLSGGQTPEQATACLHAINNIDQLKPWRLSFSYSRALQIPVLEKWKGLLQNREAAQEVLYEYAKQNVEAVQNISP